MAGASASVGTARRAVGWVFAVNGFYFASWASRLPAIRDEFHLTPARLGWVVLALSAGAVTALPLSGAVVHRLGPRRTIAVCLALAGSALIGVGAAGSVPVLVAGLFLLGVASGTWDVAMNVEAAAVEQHLGRPIMPRFHAGYSLGTVAGAAAGAVAAGAAVPLCVHFPLVVTGASVVGVLAVRRFLPDAAPGGPAATPGRAGRSGVAAAWRERRTLLIGLLVLGVAFSEGTANDWLAVAVVDGYGAGHATGASAFGLFVAAMTVARLVGPVALARFGRVPVLTAGAVLVALGVGLVAAGPVARHLGGGPGRGLALGLAAVGALAWGLGAALGFPIGMSAAADEADRAPARISVVASIGYTAFLAGPPLLGLLGDRIGILHAQLGVLGAVAVTLLTASIARPVTDAPDSARRSSHRYPESRDR